MIVYLLTIEPFHDNSSVVGIYSTLDKAEAAHPGPWLREHESVTFYGIASIILEEHVGGEQFHIRAVTIDKET